MRNLLFVSHANPEENVFSRWLALQLAKEGYGVWCDQTRLLGGEDFWADIEGAIREHACKLLYVLSAASNHRSGPLQELHVAQTIARREGLHDFIIPLRVDGTLTHSDTNIQLARINAIDFTTGWAAGLRTLLKKLQQDGVQKDERFSAGAVASWWQTQGATDITIIKSHDDYLSNWFPIRELPSFIHLHAMQTSYARSLKLEALPYPSRRLEHYLVSFASADDLATSIPIRGMILGTHQVPLDEFMGGIHQQTMVREQEAHNIVADLLRRGWENYIQSAGMSRYRLSGRSVAGFLNEGQISGNRVSVPRQDGRATNRAIVGYRARKDDQGSIAWRRFWHFAIEARPALEPILSYKLIPHILFSNDGRSIWRNRSRNQRARRGESKDWWNPEWRDRTLGLVQWLASDRQYIEVPLGSEAVIEVETLPIIFTSPVSYSEPEARQAPMTDIDESNEANDEQDGN